MAERLLQTGTYGNVQEFSPTRSADMRTGRRGPISRLKERLLKPKNAGLTGFTQPEMIVRPEPPVMGKEYEVPLDVLRPIQPEDVQTMIDDGWFEDYDRIKGLKGDVINSKTLPKEWNDQTRAEFRDNVLMPFYFPDGPIHIVAKDEKGKLIREVDVTRQTFVLEWNGELVATRSFLDKDPWARDNQYNKYKMAHAQMLLVAPDKKDTPKRKGFGTAIAIATHKELFDNQGFNMIITWVNMEGVDYGRQEKFFRSHGYEEDRSQRGLIVLNPTIPDESIEMRKYVLTPRKRDEKFASDDDPRLRWERMKFDMARDLEKIT